MKIELIQILRLFSAISILFYHSGMIGENGYFAVDIFNIISGFIILYSTQNIASKKYFLRKRLLRILPLYWALTLLMYGMIYVAPQLSIMSEAKPEYLIKSLLFLPFVNSKGYDAPILGLGWTLNYEMMFYIIFFAALHISHKYRGILAAATIIVLNVTGSISDFGGNLLLNYYTNLYMLEFVFGILAFYIIQWCKGHGLGKYRKMLFHSLGIVSAALLLCNVGVGGNLPRCFRLGIPACIMFIWLMLCFENRHFSGKLVLLGNATFSFYLLEYFSTAFFKVISTGWTKGVQWLVLSAILAVTWMGALVLYNLIEIRGTNKLKNIFLK